MPLLLLRTVSPPTRSTRAAWRARSYVELVVVTHVLSSPFASPPSARSPCRRKTAVGCVTTPRCRVYNPWSDAGQLTSAPLASARLRRRTPGRPGPCAARAAATIRSPVSRRAFVASPTTPDAVMSRSMSIGTTTPGPLCVMPYLPNDVHGRPACTHRRAAVEGVARSPRTRPPAGRARARSRSPPPRRGSSAPRSRRGRRRRGPTTGRGRRGGRSSPSCSSPPR